MLIFIAVCSNCLRRKLLKVGAAESSLRQGGYHLELGSALVSPLPNGPFGEQSARDLEVPGFHFERKGRMTKVSANCASALRRHVIGQLNSEHRMRRISRKFSRRELTPIAATHVGSAGVPGILQKSS